MYNFATGQKMKRHRDGNKLTAFSKAVILIVVIKYALVLPSLHYHPHLSPFKYIGPCRATGCPSKNCVLNCHPICNTI